MTPAKKAAPAAKPSTFTFRVEESLKKEFEAATKAMDRTAAQLLRDHMRWYVEEFKKRYSK